MSIKFKNKEHEKFYEQCLGRTGSLDPYHKAFFYTMGISGETRKHIEDVFNFREDAIRPEGMNKGWQTSGTSCLTRLAFNLWNGWNADGCATHPVLLCLLTTLSGRVDHIFSVSSLG